MTDIPSSRTTRRDWLLSERPQSRMQARLGRAYLTWARFRANRLAVIGLGIIFLLVLIAIFANLLAPHDPVVGDLAGARLLPPGTGGYLSLLGHGNERLQLHQHRQCHPHGEPGAGRGLGLGGQLQRQPIQHLGECERHR